MATAAEILAATAGTDDKVCIIDLDTRQINIPKSITALGVESDDNVKHLRFRMPRTYRGIDLFEFSIRINYINANNDPAYFAKAKDKEADNDTITFYWDVERDVVAYKGNVKFIVCMVKTDLNGEVLQELNTTVATLPVLEGLETDMENIQVAPVDYLGQLLTVKNQYVEDLDTAFTTHSGNLQTAYETHERNLRDTATILTDTVSGPYQTRANAIVNTEEGSLISVSDASDDYLRGLRVFGKSTQLSTKDGINLIDLNTKIKLDGAKYTQLADGSIQQIANDSRSITDVPVSQTLEAGDYTAFIETPMTSSALINFQLINATKGEQICLRNNNTPVTFSLDAPTAIAFKLYNANNNARAKIQINKGLDKQPWQPPSGGYTSPSPEYAQTIYNVENANINIHRKNLVRANYSKTETYEGLSFVITKGLSEVSLNGTTTKSYGYAIAEGTYLTPGQYTMSVYGLNAGDYAYLMSMNTRTRVCDNVRTDSPVTFTVTEAGIYRIDFGFANATTYDNATVKFQIEAGDKGTDYEPITAPQTITIPATLPGIPVTSGGNYTDENGQQWICDEIDFERGVYVQRIGTLSLSDVDNWTVYTSDYGHYGFMLWHALPENCSRAVGLCNQFPSVGSKSDNCVWVGVNDDSLYVVTKEWHDKGLAAWKDHLKENSLEIIYVRPTPIESPLSTAMLAAYSALHSNYPTATVMNDQGAHMELKYNADTKKTIESVRSKVPTKGPTESGSAAIKVVHMTKVWDSYEDYTPYTCDTPAEDILDATLSGQIVLAHVYDDYMPLDDSSIWRTFAIKVDGYEVSVNSLEAHSLDSNPSKLIYNWDYGWIRPDWIEDEWA